MLHASKNVFNELGLQNSDTQENDGINQLAQLVNEDNKKAYVYFGDHKTCN